MLHFRKSVTRDNPAFSAGSAGFCFALMMQVLLTAPVLAQSEQVKIFTAIDCSLHTRSEEDDEVIVFDAAYNAALCGDIAALMGRYLAANKKLKYRNFGLELSVERRARHGHGLRSTSAL